MTLREKLADWISGGALTRARAHLALSHDQGDAWMERSFVFEDRNRASRNALRTIAAMETTSANATVKRMAKTAREALE